MKNALLKLSLDSFFPPICYGCDAFGSEICSRCVEKMKPSRGNCVFCGKETNVCGECLCGKYGKLASVISLWEYDGVVAKIIKTCKYSDKPAAASLLFQYMRTKQLARVLSFLKKHKNAILIPVPLHNSKLQDRGFDQVRIMSEMLSAIARVPVIEKDVILRVKKTTPQANLKQREDRFQNALGAFFVAKPDKIRNKTAIIIDDVLTTGATIKSISESIHSCTGQKSPSVVIAHETG